MYSLQADKLIFIASQAAVERHGNEKDLFEQDVAALCEAEMAEEEAEAAEEVHEYSHVEEDPITWDQN